MPTPFWKGKNAKVLFFQDGAQVTLDVLSWSVKPNVTESADGVCGEDRDRLQTDVNFFDINLECMQQDTVGLRTLLKNVDNDDSNVLPLDKSVAFSIKPNDGTSHAFAVGGEVTVGGWEWASPGRVERAKLTIPLRAQYFKPLSTL